MYSSICVHDHRGEIRGFVCSHAREDWRIFLEALDTDDGERLMRCLSAEAPARIAVILSVEVGEPFRGQSLGRKLVEDFLRIAAADVVLAAATRPAREFFRALGFRTYGATGLMVLPAGHGGPSCETQLAA